MLKDFFLSLDKLFIFFLIYSIISLGYSLNQNFGLQKIAVLIPSYFSISFIVYFLMRNWKFINVKLHLLFLTILIMLLGMSVILFSPFQYGTAYKFEFGRWSHVVLSRWFAIGSLLILISLIYMNVKLNLVRSTILTLFFIATLIITGHRISTLAFLIALPFFMSKILRYPKRDFFLLAAFMVLITFSLFSFSNQNFSKRWGVFFSEPLTSLLNDGSTISRIEAWSASLKCLKENPILGVGIGGFNSLEISGNSNMKYPHNIILEFGSELGLFGIFLLSFMFAHMIRTLKKNSPQFVPLFIFLFILALFAKDISSNSILFSFFYFHTKRCEPS